MNSSQQRPIIPIKNLLKTNLLTHKGPQVPIATRLFHWLLSSGRYIVIFVEIIVIGAFVMRYKLDADLLTLQEEITAQTAYVQSKKSDEDIIRVTQLQLTSIREAREQAVDIPAFLTKIAGYTPKTIRLISINIDQDKSNTPAITVTGTTPSNLELSAFLKALQKDPNFNDVTLANISFEGQTKFTITATLIQKGGIKS